LRFHVKNLRRALATDEMLRAIAVFRSAFTLGSALAIASVASAPTTAMLDAMAGLVAKSTLVADGAGEVVQYRLLEPARNYAAEKLRAAGESVEVARRHVDHQWAMRRHN
jgi:predicted ATPase